MLKPVADLTTVMQGADLYTLLSPGTFFFFFLPSIALEE